MRVEGRKGGDNREYCNTSTANIIATATAVNQYSPPHGQLICLPSPAHPRLKLEVGLLQNFHRQ